MKKKLLLMSAIASAGQLYGAAQGEGKLLAGQKEIKKMAGEKEIKKSGEQALITASTLGRGSVKLYVDDQPVQFTIADVGSADSVKIFDVLEDGDNQLLDGIAYKASDANNKFFMVEFSKDKSGKEWQFPRVLFQSSVNDIKSLSPFKNRDWPFAKGTEWIKGIVVGKPPKTRLYAIAGAWFDTLHDKGNGFAVMYFDAAKAAWSFKIRDPFANPQGVGRLPGYEKAKVAKINWVNAQMIKNYRDIDFEMRIQVNFDVSGVDTQKYPAALTDSWEKMFTVGE